MARRRARGEGAITRRKSDGLWRGALVLPGPGGKRKYLYSKTKAGVAKKLREARAKLERGEPVDASAMPLSEFLARWLRDEVEGTRSPRTVESYHYATSKLLGSTTLAEAPLSRLNALAIRESLNTIPAGRRREHAYVVLHAALEQAVEWGLLGPVNPCARVARPRHEPRTPPPPDVEALGRLLGAACEHPMIHAPVVLAALAGLRFGEIAALRWRAVNVEGRRLFIESGKSKASRRVVPVASLVIDALGPRQHPEAWVCPSPHGTAWDRSHFHRHWKPLRQSVGLPDLHFHDLRHWHLSLFAAASGDPKAVQARAGHASAAFTLSRYGHELPGAQVSAADEVAARVLLHRPRREPAS